MSHHKPHLNNPEVAHESRDVPIKGIAYFMVGLVVTIVATMLLVGWLFDIMLRQAQEAAPAPYPLASERKGPSGPLLQVSSGADLIEMRAQEQKILTSYAWISPQDKIIRIPISVAVDYVAKHGLPAWTAPAAPAAEGAAQPEASTTPAPEAPAAPAVSNESAEQTAPPAAESEGSE